MAGLVDPIDLFSQLLKLTVTCKQKPFTLDHVVILLLTFNNHSILVTQAYTQNNNKDTAKPAHTPNVNLSNQSTVLVSLVTSKHLPPALTNKYNTTPDKYQSPPPHLTMPQPTKPASMSLSEWRHWCCCYPNATPPNSSPGQRETVSLEEFDPGNRMSMSRAFERRPSTTLPPRTSKNSNDSTPPAVAARRPEASSQPRRSEKPKPKTEDRSGQRPTTLLLPSPPPRPSGPRESKVFMGEPDKPRIVRQEPEPWWQAGRRMMERNEKEWSQGQGSRERK